MSIWQTISTTLIHINRKEDLTPWERPYTGKLPIYGVYHVFAPRAGKSSCPCR